MGISIGDRGPSRHRHAHVFGFAAIHLLSLAITTRLGFKVALITKVHQRAQPFIHIKNNTPATATIAASRAAERHELFVTECHHPVATFSGLYFNCYLIDKHKILPGRQLRQSIHHIRIAPTMQCWQSVISIPEMLLAARDAHRPVINRCIKKTSRDINRSQP